MPLSRPHYFAGRVLTAEDFLLEQAYQRERGRRHNRLLHGVGVVRGLTVKLEQGGRTPRVVVSPGAALSPLGDELELERPAELALPGATGAWRVVLRAVERLAGPLPTAEGETEARFSRVEESSEVVLVPEPEELAVGDLVLARYVAVRRRWRRDARVKAPRGR